MRESSGVEATSMLPVLPTHWQEVPAREHAVPSNSSSHQQHLPAPPADPPSSQIHSGMEKSGARGPDASAASVRLALGC